MATAAPGREVETLAAKVEKISKSVARAEGGDRDLQDLAAQGDAFVTNGMDPHYFREVYAYTGTYHLPPLVIQPHFARRLSACQLRA